VVATSIKKKKVINLQCEDIIHALVVQWHSKNTVDVDWRNNPGVLVNNAEDDGRWAKGNVIYSNAMEKHDSDELQEGRHQ